METDRWLTAAVRDRRSYPAEGGKRRALRGSASRPNHKSAILADPRNDENVIIAGLHAAFLFAHNRAVALVRSETPGIADDDAFVAARRLITRHYHWLILHEFLPLFVGQAMVDDILTRGRRFYVPRHDRAFIPVEFQVSYRFGHSMVRPSYRANLAGDNGEPFFAMVFDPAGEGRPHSHSAICCGT